MENELQNLTPEQVRQYFESRPEPRIMSGEQLAIVREHPSFLEKSEKIMKLIERFGGPEALNARLDELHRQSSRENQ